MHDSHGNVPDQKIGRSVKSCGKLVSDDPAMKIVRRFSNRLSQALSRSVARPVGSIGNVLRACHTSVRRQAPSPESPLLAV
jgi:hypothetical protein